MPVASEEPMKEGEKGDLYQTKIQSSSTLASEDLDYIPEILLIGSSNEALKGEQSIMDGLQEESFTLETFDRLIRKSYEKGVAFLLARVTTMDDSQRLYHSYYSAYQINKVLFRTQPELGLLHRMKAKNPLNNMEIVGDVDYFMVDAKSYEKAMKKLHIEVKKDEFQRTDSFLKRKHKRTLSDSSYVKQSSSGKLEKLPTVYENNESYHSTILLHEEYLKREDRAAPSAPKRKIQYEAKFFATDDDYLMKTEVREIFKKNAIQPNDYMLFTLFGNGGEQNQAYNDGPAPAAARIHERRIRPPAKLSNLWGCINTTATPSLTNNVTGFLTNRGIGIFFVLYVIVAVLVLNFTIPANFIYLAGFGFVFVFSLILICFVEAGPRDRQHA